jgi:hypothetical protein
MTPLRRPSDWMRISHSIRPRCVDSFLCGPLVPVGQRERRRFTKEFALISGETAHVPEAASVSDALNGERTRFGRLQMLPGAVQGEAARPFLRGYPSRFSLPALEPHRRCREA